MPPSHNHKPGLFGWFARRRSQHKRRPAFHITTAVADFGDAVTYDVLAMVESLRTAGYTAYAFAEHISPSLTGQVRPLAQFRGLTEDILIYHHSSYWEHGQKLWDGFGGKKILRYHNVTPARFFTGYSVRLADMCERGRAQTRDLVQHGASFFLADSQFNRQELLEAGADAARTHVLPPFHHAADLQKTKPSIEHLRKYLDGSYNILFVGRFAPDKGHLNLLITFAYLLRYVEPRARLILAGRMSPELSTYGDEILAGIEELDLTGAVEIVADASAEQLRAIYLSAHVFLCLSEHEGFSVPLVESMLHKIPVVALRGNAVPETLGPDALVADRVDPPLISEMIAECLHEGMTSRWLADRQLERYQKYFSNEAIGRTFHSLIDLWVS